MVFMLGNEGENVKASVRNFFLAILDLMPSQNLVSMFLSMLPLRYSDAKELFPEIVENKDLFEYLQKVFSLYVGDIIKVGPGLGQALCHLIDEFFKILSVPEKRALLTVLIGEDLGNLDRVFFKEKLDALMASLENSDLKDAVLKILKIFVEKNVSGIWKENIEDIPEEQLNLALDILYIYKIISEPNSYIRLYRDSYLKYLQEELR